jgi:hypothetical protein
LVRLDKIGDLISTLPVDQTELQTSTQTSGQFTWIINQGLEPVVEHSIPKRCKKEKIIPFL